MTIPQELLNLDVLCYDTETAVLGDYICEIGFALFKNGQLDHEWGMYVNPTVPIDPEASKVNNIYDKDVMHELTFRQLAWYIYNTLNVADIHIVYNYGYDRGVLENEFQRLGMKFPIKPVVDPFIFFKQYNKFNKGKTLVKAAEKYGIPLIGAHRAMNDASASGKVIFKIAATKTNFPKDLSILLKKQRQWIEFQHEDLSKYFASVGKDPPDKPVYSYYEF